MRLDQVIPNLSVRDAVGAHTMAISEYLRGVGIDSDVYYGEAASPEAAALGRPVVHLGRSARNRSLLYQFSIGSPVFDIVASRAEPILVNYHNITPAEMIERWEPKEGHELRLGRAQLGRLAPRVRLAVADSEFNRQELCEKGYDRTAVVPLLIDMTGAGVRPDPAVLRRLEAAGRTGGADLLFVGKVAPHKAPHDLVTMLAVFRRLYDPAARLHLVGACRADRYERALRALIDRLGLTRAVEMTGSVSPETLEAYYRGADAFVCASEHEGFCVPIVEAMAHGLPVVAYAAAAVPETVGGAGLLLTDKRPLPLAVAVARLLGDGTSRDRLVAEGRRRARHFAVQRSAATMTELLAGALAARRGGPVPRGDRAPGDHGLS